MNNNRDVLKLGAQILRVRLYGTDVFIPEESLYYDRVILMCSLCDPHVSELLLMTLRARERAKFVLAGIRIPGYLVAILAGSDSALKFGRVPIVPGFRGTTIIATHMYL